jgi:hypothetical protein
MHKSATKCNETVGKLCRNKHGASKIIDTLETYHPSSPRLTPSMQAAVPALGIGAGVTVGPPLFGLASNYGEASQGPLTTRAVRSECGETSLAPKVVTKDASRGKAPATVARSGIGSLSSASQLQQEWADTASCVDAVEKLKDQGSKPTLAELNK